MKCDWCKKKEGKVENMTDFEEFLCDDCYEKHERKEEKRLKRWLRT